MRDELVNHLRVLDVFDLGHHDVLAQLQLVIAELLAVYRRQQLLVGGRELIMLEQEPLEGLEQVHVVLLLSLSKM